MTCIVHAQLEAHQAKKLEQIRADTGLTVSQILRLLVDSAEYSPLKLRSGVYLNADGDHAQKGEPVAI